MRLPSAYVQSRQGTATRPLARPGFAGGGLSLQGVGVRASGPKSVCAQPSGAGLEGCASGLVRCRVQGKTAMAVFKTWSPFLVEQLGSWCLIFGRAVGELVSCDDV